MWYNSVVLNALSPAAVEFWYRWDEYVVEFGLTSTKIYGVAGRTIEQAKATLYPGSRRTRKTIAAAIEELCEAKLLDADDWESIYKPVLASKVVEGACDVDVKSYGSAAEIARRIVFRPMKNLKVADRDALKLSLLATLELWCLKYRTLEKADYVAQPGDVNILFRLHDQLGEDRLRAAIGTAFDKFRESQRSGFIEARLTLRKFSATINRFTNGKATAPATPPGRDDAQVDMTAIGQETKRLYDVLSAGRRLAPVTDEYRRALLATCKARKFTCGRLRYAREQLAVSCKFYPAVEEWVSVAAGYVPPVTTEMLRMGMEVKVADVTPELIPPEEKAKLRRMGL